MTTLSSGSNSRSFLRCWTVPTRKVRVNKLYSYSLLYLVSTLFFFPLKTFEPAFELTISRVFFALDHFKIVNFTVDYIDKTLFDTLVEISCKDDLCLCIAIFLPQVKKHPQLFYIRTGNVDFIAYNDSGNLSTCTRYKCPCLLSFTLSPYFAMIL